MSSDCAANRVRALRRSLDKELPTCTFDDIVIEFLANSLDGDEPLSEDRLAEDWSPFLIANGACRTDSEAKDICRGLLARYRSEDGSDQTAAGDTAAGPAAGAPQRPKSIIVGSALEEWLAKLKLSQYAVKARAWCERMGASNINEVMDCWEQWATELNLKPLERKRVEKDVSGQPPKTPYYKPPADTSPMTPASMPGASPVSAAKPAVATPVAAVAAAGGSSASSAAPVNVGFGRGQTRPSTFGPPDDPHRYELLEEIGTGATATVHRCRRGDQEFAVKTISLSKLRLQRDYLRKSEMLHREVNILFSLRHQRIVSLHDVVEDPMVALHLVMELVDGGELFDRIIINGCFSEPVARYVFLQVAEGLKYIHSKDIVHRDLKPENILVDDKASRKGLIEVKLSDFGHSKLINDGYSTALTRVGTPQYWAPEVSDPAKAALGYDQAVDLWSLGVVLYVMVVGSYPFDGVDDRMEEQIKRAHLTFRCSDGRELSPLAKDLICSLIRVNPRQRLSLDECLKHPWVSTDNPVPRMMKLCTEVNPCSLDLTVRLPFQPSKELVHKLRTDLMKWQTKFCFAATVKHREVIVVYGDERNVDQQVVDVAQHELEAIISYHFQVVATGCRGYPTSAQGDGRLPTVQEENNRLQVRPQSFRLLNYQLRVTDDGAGLELAPETNGMRITDIFDKPGQPGLQKGDLITKIEEVPLRGVSSRVEGIFGTYFADGALLAVRRQR